MKLSDSEFPISYSSFRFGCMRLTEWKLLRNDVTSIETCLDLSMCGYLHCWLKIVCRNWTSAEVPNYFTFDVYRLFPLISNFHGTHLGFDEYLSSWHQKGNSLRIISAVVSRYISIQMSRGFAICTTNRYAWANESFSLICELEQL